MGLVPVNKYTVWMQGYSRAISLKKAVELYKKKYGKRPVKAVVPIDYDMKLTEGVKIKVETSKSVQTILLSDQYFVWANGPADGVPARNQESNEIDNDNA